MPDEKIARLADALVERGLRHAFGVTGSGASMALIMGLESRGVAYHGVAHEAAAAIMAGTVASTSGRPSVSISIKGPGLANMLPGVAFNHFEGNPALSIAESFGPDAPSHKMHKQLDHPALLSPVAKAITGPGEDDTGRALDLAFAEVPGPVHIELGGAAGADGSVDVATGATSLPDDRHIGLPAGARRPAVIAGSLGARRGFGEALSALRVPVFTTAAAKGLIDEASPYSAGVYTGAGGELAPETTILGTADLVVGIGLRNTEVLAANRLAPGSILADSVDGGLADGFNGGLVLTGDEGVLGLIEGLRKYQWGADVIAGALELLRAELLTGWLPGDCFEMMNGLDWDHGLVLDTGSFCTVGEHVWLASRDRPFLGSSNGRFMGAGIPSAIGASLAGPGLPLFCVVGDGGVRPYGAEIGVAVELGLPICFLLMSDGRYGSVAGAPGTRIYSERAVNVARPSWWRTADSMGCPAGVVESTVEFAAAADGWNRTGPLFLQASFDRDHYAAMTGRVRP